MRSLVLHNVLLHCIAKKEVHTLVLKFLFPMGLGHTHNLKKIKTRLDFNYEEITNERTNKTYRSLMSPKFTGFQNTLHTHLSNLIY